MRICTVSTRKNLREFLRLPWKVYAGDPNWVPPLLSDVKSRLDPRKNPFFEHGQAESFIAVENGETLGRITAIIDESYNAFHQEKVGYFGFFECLQRYDVAEALFNRARSWCKERGMVVFRGPTNLTMNDDCAFLLEGFDSSPVLMMTYNPRYYIEFVNRYGFRKAKDLYAFLKQRQETPERILRLVERIKTKERLTIRPFDMKQFHQSVEKIMDVYNSAWEKNWGFVPLTREEIVVLAKKLKPLAVPELLLFAEIDEKPVGVVLTLPDYNQVFKKLNGRLGPLQLLKFFRYRKRITGIRSILFGVKKEYRNRGIEAVLYYATEQAAMKLGYQWCELSWNLEDNDLINRFDESVGGKLYKKYRIFEMEI